MWNKAAVNPSEMQNILVFDSFANEYHVGFWSSDENMLVQFNDGGDGWKWPFTHWMPLPVPPTAEERNEI